MASLGSILMGSAIGQGAANFVREGARAKFDEQRFNQAAAEMEQAQKERDYRNDVIARERQAWDIDSSVPQGDTDEAKLQWLADKAAKVGRGDLQRKYLGEATKAAQARKHQAIAAAAVATVQGDPKAVNLWNQSGLYEGGTLVGIQPKMAADGRRDPSGDFIFSVKDPDSGQILPLEVPAGLMALGAAEPEQIPLILERAQRTNTTASVQEKRLEAQINHWDAQENHWKVQDANAIRKAMSSGGGGVGRLTDQRWRYQWALSQIGKPGGFKDEREAMEWAQDPNRANKDFWKSMTLAGNVANAGGFYSVQDLKEIASVLRPAWESHRHPGGGGSGGQDVPPPAKVDFKGLGFVQDSKSGNWKNPKTGVWFKVGPDGKPVAWSNAKNAWVPVQ